MSQQYASNQPSGFQNHVENIAIVGAGGNMGSYITQELLKTKKYKTTAVTRAQAGSSSKFPEGVIVKEVNYDDQFSLVEALEGQDVLIILISVTAPPNTQDKLSRAAADAGVPRVLPSEWAGDPKETEIGKGIFVGPQKQATRDFIDSVRKSSWIGMVANFWYEFSLAGSPTRFGFDFFNRVVTFYSEGTEAIDVSTYNQCACAVANLLSLKVLSEHENDKSPTLFQFKNKILIIFKPFNPTVTLLGTKADWQTILHKLDKLKSWGAETTQFEALLRPVITRFVMSFHYPDSTDIVDFWQRVISRVGHGSGVKCLNRSTRDDFDTNKPGYSLDGVVYHKIDIESVPPGWISVPVTIVELKQTYQTMMVAGSVGIQGSQSSTCMINGPGDLDCVSPKVAGACSRLNQPGRRSRAP